MINPRVGMPVWIAIYYLSHDITNSNLLMKKAKKVNKLKKAVSAREKKAVKAKK